MSGPAIIIPKETEIDIYVAGSCTAAPGENLFDVLSELSAGKRRNGSFFGREVTGGGTVSLVNSIHGPSFFVGLGDFPDYQVFQKNVSRYGIPAGLRGSFSLHTHPHPISVRNYTRIGDVTAYISERDWLLPIVLDPSGKDIELVDKRIFSLYERHRKEGLKPEDFTRIDPENPNIGWLPENIKLFATPGHDKSCMAMYIDGRVRVNVHDNADFPYVLKGRHGAVIEDDNLCDARYIAKAMKGDSGSVYDMNSFDPWIDDPEADLRSQGKILDYAGSDGIMIPGHGTPCTVRALRNCEPLFRTTYSV
ncbi:MAG: hypothetical protein V1813_00830 [Candidatus Aenigmatarchaeota archaeon]